MSARWSCCIKQNRSSRSCLKAANPSQRYGCTAFPSTPSWNKCTTPFKIFPSLPCTNAWNQAKQVSDKRKKIKRLRDKLMQELVATFKDVSPETLADLGYGSGDNLTAVDKVRANLEAVAQESYVTMDEKEAMMELERENKVLRCERLEMLHM